MSNVEEKQKKTNRALTITAIILGVIGVAILFIVAIGIFRDFDAQTYTKVILDQTFKGEVGEEAEMIEGSTTEGMIAQYEEGIETFVQNSIVGELPMSEDMKSDYITLTKQIFSSVKYEVLEAEKIDKREFKVPVEYQAMDLFKKFTEARLQEKEALEEKAYNAEYKGSEEEIETQMMEEFLNNCYAHMESLAKEIAYGEKQTMVLTIAADESGSFRMDEEELSQFIEKILGLDAIQD